MIAGVLPRALYAIWTEDASPSACNRISAASVITSYWVPEGCRLSASQIFSCFEPLKEQQSVRVCSQGSMRCRSSFHTINAWLLCIQRAACSHIEQAKDVCL